MRNPPPTSLSLLPADTPPGELIAVMANQIARCSNSLTLYELKLFLWLIAQVKPEDTELHSHSLHVRDFAGFVRREDQGSIYRQTALSAKGLMQKLIEIPVEEHGKIVRKTLQWITIADYHDAEGYVTLRLHDRMMPFVMQLRKHFAVVPVTQFFQLRSRYAVQFFLYGISWQSAGGWDMNIAELREWLRIDPKDMHRVSNLQQVVITRSQAEIAERTDYRLLVRANKAGRRVTGWHFDIQRVTTPSLVGRKPRAALPARAPVALLTDREGAGSLPAAPERPAALPPIPALATATAVSYSGGQQPWMGPPEGWPRAPKAPTYAQLKALVDEFYTPEPFSEGERHDLFTLLQKDWLTQETLQIVRKYRALDEGRPDVSKSIVSHTGDRAKFIATFIKQLDKARLHFPRFKPSVVPSPVPPPIRLRPDEAADVLPVAVTVLQAPAAAQVASAPPPERRASFREQVTEPHRRQHHAHQRRPKPTPPPEDDLFGSLLG